MNLQISEGLLIFDYGQSVIDGCVVVQEYYANYEPAGRGDASAAAAGEGGMSPDSRKPSNTDKHLSYIMQKLNISS